MKSVLGLDLGTQSLKALFYDYENRRTVALVASPLPLDQDRQGKAEQEAQWWLKALADCMNQVSPEIKASVQCLAVSGQQHGFVALNEKGEVLAPVKLWCDTATQTEVAEITANCGGREKAIALSGNPVLAGYTSPKILWLKKNRPDQYRELRHILLPHDYLNYVLSGSFAMEYGDASGTGLLDVVKRQWSRPMLKAVDADRDLEECLPPLYEADAMIGFTTDIAAKNYGIPAGIPVATGGGDNMMGAIGTGNVEPGKISISLGSSGTLYGYSDSPLIDPKGNIAAFCSSSGGWLPLLCTMNCTLATELMRGMLELSLEDVDALAAQVPPGSDALLALPFFHGERSPALPHGSGAILGMTSYNSSKGHLLRATMEGCSFSLKFGFEELKALGLQAGEIILTGGGSRSGQWRRIIADLFQLSVVSLQEDEGACFGAALQALWVLQKQASPDLSLADICRDHIQRNAMHSLDPDVKNGERYREIYEHYRQVLQGMTPLLNTCLAR